MRITITNDRDQVWSQEVDGNLDIATIKMLCAVDLSMDHTKMIFMFDGRPLTASTETLAQCGINDGDVLMAVSFDPNQMAQMMRNSQARQAQSNRPTDYSQKASQLITEWKSRVGVMRERWPAMARAIEANDVQAAAELLKEHDRVTREEDEKLRRAEANPNDPESQKYLEERIRQRNVEASFQEALENSPEMFGTVIMLYINCKVNGQHVKAFVDSGAQTTIMSASCAKRCNVMRLLDKRFATTMKGVGTQRSLGRIHTGQIQIGEAFIPQSFSVLEDQPMDMLIGLDMLKRHQCVLDLNKNILKIGTTGTTVSFLTEGELDASARLAGPEAEKAHQEEMEIDKAIEASKIDAAKEENKPGPSGSAPIVDPKVSRIVQMTKCSESAAKEALVKFNGDQDAAALSILTSGLGKS